MKAYELLSNESNWTKGHYAKDADGSPCDPLFDGARCFCFAGAINRCYSSNVRAVRWKIVKVVGMSVATWNDAPRTTHAEVLGVLKKLDI